MIRLPSAVPSLSTPIGELQAHYGVVVVGSGYGASVVAHRMAELAQNIAAGGQTFSVCVLERGLEIPTGDYPATLTQVARQMQVDTSAWHIGSRTALFDLHLNRDIGALVGCGLGGGSLINAGVMLQPRPDVFDEAWPQDIRREGLDRYFDEVRAELGAVEVPPDKELLKVSQLLDAARVPLPWSRKNHPPVAVSFQTGVNKRGVQQKACALCGDCMTGCNHAAKNTLVMNYLPAAAAAGAAIFCGMDVREIAWRNNRWHLHVRMLNPAFQTFGSPEITIQADAVFLGAGTLGSVEILLRSQKRGLSLSRHIGKRFSGNGDVIAFAYNAPEPVNGFGYGSYVPADAAVGPLISGMLDERDAKSGAMIQEGTVPGALAPLLRFAAPLMARVSDRPIDLSADLRFRHFRRELDTMLRGVRHGALNRTQTFLGMGRDKARGEMRLRRDRLRLSWPPRLERDDDALPKTTRRMSELTRSMKARYLVNPFWSRVFGRRRVTVHPLGGACMADSAEQGVVDANGRVFENGSGTEVHSRLFVCDGSVVPGALGTNPALTIAALASRIADQAAGSIAQLTPATVARPGRVRTSVAGIHYAERLRGRISLDGLTSKFTLVLHISAEDLGDLIDLDSEHAADVIGVLTAPDLPDGYKRFMVSDGTFRVMVDDPSRVDSKLITYAFTMTADNGDTLTWFGQKTINHDEAKSRGFWKVVSSYDFTVKRGSAAVGGGTASSSVLDAVRLGASMRITHTRRWAERQRLRSAFTWYFVSSLLKALVRPLGSIPVDPFTPSTKMQVLQALQYVDQVREIQDSKRGSRPRFKVAAYRSKQYLTWKGTVLLAPGFGMSADAFLLKDSLTQSLCEEGYEVWLLDYRASDRLAASLEQFTLDDLAIGDATIEPDTLRAGSIAGDFPDAIEEIFKVTGSKVQIVAHCVASLTTFMSLLAGTLNEEHVQSVILSQSFACINHPWINRFKAFIRLPQVLKYFQFVTVMTPDYDLRSGWRSRLLDRLLTLYPTQEHCSSGVCRRLLLMYGEVLRHDQLTKETHDLVYHLFDRANMTTFIHLSRMISRGHIVDSKGRDTYLTTARTRTINVPITLLQGEGNRLFKPRGAQRTIKWLHDHGGHGAANKTMFQLEMVPAHGHLDTFIGKNAKTKVYPVISRLLLTGAAAAPAPAVGHPVSETSTAIGPSIKWGSNSASVGS